MLKRHKLLRSRRNYPLDTAGLHYRGKITLRTRCAHRPKPPNSVQKPTASVEQSVELYLLLSFMHEAGLTRLILVKSDSANTS